MQKTHFLREKEHKLYKIFLTIYIKNNLRSQKKKEMVTTHENVKFFSWPDLYEKGPKSDKIH